MDEFFREKEVKFDCITECYKTETLALYAKDLISRNIPFSLALLDVDNFTYIKDAFGIEDGNKVLRDIAEIVKSLIGDDGVLARGDSDEFMLIFKNIVDYDKIWNLCHTICVKITEISLPEVGNQTLTVTMGVSRYPENAKHFDCILSCSEKALYRGKSKGRNCFIIYLPEKHASLNPKNEKQQALGAINIQSNIFRFLTAPDDLKTGITNLFNFISSYYEVDHVCIQGEKDFYFQKIHQISKTKDFIFIPHDLILNSVNKVTGVLYINDTKNLVISKQDELYKVLKKQNITSACFCNISYREKTYGMLRIDMTGTDNENRLLSYSDMDLLLSAAKIIALILHYNNKTIETL